MLGKIVKTVLCSCGVMAAAGCINIEYVGQSFPPLPESEPVLIFSPESPAPEKGYRIIGRAIVTAPDNKGPGIIRPELANFAREHGADAVNIVAYNRILLGTAAPDSGRLQPNNWNRDGRNAGGAYIYTNSFGEPAELSKPGKAIYEQQFKVQLMVTDERFKQIEKLYKEERAKLEQLPAAPAPQASSAEQALDKSVRSVEVSPAVPLQPEKAPAKRPVNMELSSDSNPAVAL